MKQIADMGGSVRAIETGWMQTQIAEASWEFQRDVDDKREIVVGVNEYTDGGEQPPSIFSVDRRLVEHQLRRLAHHRARARQRAREGVAGGADGRLRGDREPDAPILDAVRAYATLGEILRGDARGLRRVQPADGYLSVRSLRRRREIRSRCSGTMDRWRSGRRRG